MRNLDKFRGCLIGGAAGDALGYEVEFMDLKSIQKQFGASGIAAHELHNGIAQISDDTQMTLFTATGLLLGTTRGMTRGIMGSYASYIGCAYRDWLKTQQGKYPEKDEYRYSWLSNVRGLYGRRAPGMTCMIAIESGCDGTVENPINNSKGCGGVMRVAPIGLYFVDKKCPVGEVARIGAEAAALTHGHQLGYLPAAVLTHMIYELAGNEELSVSKAVDHAISVVEQLYPEADQMQVLKDLVQKACQLAEQNLADTKAIAQLGAGWVAEETLAIAIYCALKYENDFDRALIASVNHSGDSDSTGAVTGNILGAKLGLEGIPEKYINNLELCDLIMEVADDLHHDCRITELDTDQDPVWVKKYLKNIYGRDTMSEERLEYNWRKSAATLQIRKISITEMDVDCVVNAANSHLQHGGGVCGAIFAAAGAKELQKACDRYGYCETGEAVITPGFQLRAKHIVHAVGPIWKGGNQNEEKLLYNCYQNAMKLAYHNGCKSIAFPLISSGIYGYPVQEAWRVAIRAIRESACPMEVTIAVIDDKALSLGNSILAEFGAEPKQDKSGEFQFFWHEYEDFGELSQ